MNFGTYRLRRGRGNTPSDALLPRVGPFAKLSPQLVSSLGDTTVSTTITRSNTPGNPDIRGHYTLTNNGQIDTGPSGGGFWLWCDYFEMQGVASISSSVATGANGSSGTNGGSGGQGFFGGGTGAAANTTAGTYVGGASGTTTHSAGFSGQTADGYTTGTPGAGYASLPTNFYFNPLPQAGKGGNVSIGAFTGGAGGGGGGSGGIVCIVCNRWRYDPVSSYYAALGGGGGSGTAGGGCGNGGDGGDGGIIAIFTKNKITSGGIMAPGFNFDIDVAGGGIGGSHGSAGARGKAGQFQFWEIRKDNSLVRHWSPNDTWNNL